MNDFEYVGKRVSTNYHPFNVRGNVLATVVCVLIDGDLVIRFDDKSRGHDGISERNIKYGSWGSPGSRGHWFVSKKEITLLKNDISELENPEYEIL